MQCRDGARRVFTDQTDIDGLPHKRKAKREVVDESHEG